MLLIYTKPQRWTQFHLSTTQLNQLRHVLHVNINFFKPPNQATFHSCHPVHAKNAYAEALSKQASCAPSFLTQIPSPDSTVMCLAEKRGIYQIQCLVPPSINIKPLFHTRDGAGLAPFCMCSSCKPHQEGLKKKLLHRWMWLLGLHFPPLWFNRKGEVKRCPA
ncbi:hypothetical protein CI102_10989 [Trichoderma harzianum]|nr:hypothetical protein CI102_10989 [Trichoderma harzianum]